ncbi:hypothetical protein Tco_1147334, partial [Tanacetum coccineum]
MMKSILVHSASLGGGTVGGEVDKEAADQQDVIPKSHNMDTDGKKDFNVSQPCKVEISEAIHCDFEISDVSTPG